MFAYSDAGFLSRDKERQRIARHKRLT